MQIKVDNVRREIIMKGGTLYHDPLPTPVLVTEGILVFILPKENDYKGGNPLKGFSVIPGTENLFFKPLLISKTEKIEVGDKFWSKADNFIDECIAINGDDVKGKRVNIDTKTSKDTNYYPFKVLALPEHFSKETIQEIIDGKLKNGSKVLLECVALRRKSNEFTSAERDMVANRIGYASEEFLYELCPNEINVIKISSHKHITLHKKEERRYTRDEVYDILCRSTFRDENEEDIDEWFEKNVE